MFIFSSFYIFIFLYFYIFIFLYFYIFICLYFDIFIFLYFYILYFFILIFLFNLHNNLHVFNVYILPERMSNILFPHKLLWPLPPTPYAAFNSFNCLTHYNSTMTNKNLISNCQQANKQRK